VGRLLQALLAAAALAAMVAADDFASLAAFRCVLLSSSTFSPLGPALLPQNFRGTNLL
jgi:hypothetical protein